jgi:hypothetical protein
MVGTLDSVTLWMTLRVSIGADRTSAIKAVSIYVHNPRGEWTTGILKVADLYVATQVMRGRLRWRALGRRTLVGPGHQVSARNERC